MKPLTKKWVKKAEEDYRVATRELKAKPASPSAICFHSQQCIEKYIKAILQEDSVSFPKIHDLEQLLKKCIKFTPELEKYREDLIWLTAFRVEIRYPGFDLEFDDARESVTAMKKIRKLLKAYFKQ